MRARMAVRYAGVDVELREVVLKNKPPEMIEISSKGTVPVLQFNDQVIDESIDVMLWALQQADPDNWLAAQDDSMALVAMNDDVFKPHLDGYKYAVKGEEQKMRHHRDEAETHLQYLEQRLASTSYLSGRTLTLSDVALMPFIRQFANVDINWFESTPYTRLQAWLGSLLETPMFTDVMKKYPAWQYGDEITVF